MIPFILVAAAICALPISPSGRIMAHTRRRLHPVVIPLVVALMVPAILATDRSTLLISACMAGVVALRAVTAARARKAHENALAATSTFLVMLLPRCAPGPACLMRVPGRWSSFPRILRLT